MATNGNSYFDMNFSSPLGEINAEINIRKSLENSHLIFTFTQSEPAASHLEPLGYIGQVRFEAGSGENTIPYLTVITHRVWEETPIPVVPVPEAVPASEETPAPEATAVSEMAPTLEVAPEVQPATHAISARKVSFVNREPIFKPYSGPLIHLKPLEGVWGSPENPTSIRVEFEQFLD